MGLTSHLAQRGKFGFYQLRLAVPNRLRPIVGKREFTRSLRTSDRQTAERLAIPILGEWIAIITDADRSAAAFDSRAVAFEAGFENLLPRLDRARMLVAPGVAAFREFNQKRESELLDLVRRRRDEKFDIWEGIADRTIANRGLPLVKGSDEYRQFVLEIAEGCPSSEHLAQSAA